MSRTQDLALARLRLIARRWQGASWEADAARPDPAKRDAVRPDPAKADVARPDPVAHPGPAPDDEPGLDDPEHDDAQAWPPSTPWLRLLTLLVGIVAVGGTALLYTSWPRDRPPAVAAPSSAPGAGTFDDPFLAASPAPSPSLIVHVVGEVRRPGVVMLPAGSRVVDAVKAAGGLRRRGQLGATNLAQVLVDGERIEVGAVEGAGAAGAVASGGTATGPLNLNTASAEQLDTLPGIGPVTAAKILAWRTTNGRFTAVDELSEVPGIGPKTLAELRPLVRV